MTAEATREQAVLATKNLTSINRAETYAALYVGDRLGELTELLRDRLDVSPLTEILRASVERKSHAEAKPVTKPEEEKTEEKHVTRAKPKV